MSSSRGFTYLELLFVVGIMGVSAAVAIPALNNAAARNRVFTSGELVAAQIREARLAAITRNQPFRVAFDCPAPGAIRMLAVTGNNAIDNAVDRCTNAQPNDGPPVYMPQNVAYSGGPPALEINGRGQISVVGGGSMPQNISVTYGSHTRQLVVTATGRVTTPAY